MVYHVSFLRDIRHTMRIFLLCLSCWNTRSPSACPILQSNTAKNRASVWSQCLTICIAQNPMRAMLPAPAKQIGCCNRVSAARLEFF